MLLLAVARYDVRHNLDAQKGATRNEYSNPDDDPEKERNIVEMRRLPSVGGMVSSSSRSSSSGSGNSGSRSSSSRPAVAAYKPVMNPLTGYSRYQQ